ncbi:MAG: hypothetical protein LBQ30_07690 [Treponema sp.]|jgi:hypothetical protein|nr:hypothetical protein [Treponema sp.]
MYPSAKSLHEDVKEYFEDLDVSAPSDKIRHIRFNSVWTHDERIDDRDYAVSDDMGWLVKRHPYWKTIGSIGMVESSRSWLRKDKGPENRAILRKLALTVARADTETKSSSIGRRKQMMWSHDYLERLLFQSSLVSDTTDSG